ncbi:MAG: biotin/lipoyl-binding protein [Bacteroidales bacterium]|nr:biotin/lipoyl-binding protein [Bacteroidales bacterium]
MKEYKYKINGTDYKVGVGDIDHGIVTVEVNGTPYQVEIEHKSPAPVKVINAPKASKAPRTAEGEKIIAKPAAGPTGGYAVKAPLPGVVLSVSVKVGDTVKASDTVAVLEAMKMENAIRAGRDGKIASINVKDGESVLENTVIVTLE